MSAPCSTCNSNAHSLGNYCDCFEAIEIKHLKSINDDYMRIRSENARLQKAVEEAEKVIYHVTLCDENDVEFQGEKLYKWLKEYGKETK